MYVYNEWLMKSGNMTKFSNHQMQVALLQHLVKSWLNFKKVALWMVQNNSFPPWWLSGSMKWPFTKCEISCQTSNITCTFDGNKIVGSLRCIWSIAYRCCSTYIFILDLTPGFNILGGGNRKTRQESFRFWDLVCLILAILQYMMLSIIH